MLHVVFTHVFLPMLGLYAYMIVMLWVAFACGWEIRIDEKKDGGRPSGSKHRKPTPRAVFLR